MPLLHLVEVSLDGGFLDVDVSAYRFLCEPRAPLEVPDLCCLDHCFCFTGLKKVA